MGTSPSLSRRPGPCYLRQECQIESGAAIISSNNSISVKSRVPSTPNPCALLPSLEYRPDRTATAPPSIPSDLPIRRCGPRPGPTAFGLHERYGRRVEDGGLRDESQLGGFDPGSALRTQIWMAGEGKTLDVQDVCYLAAAPYEMCPKRSRHMPRMGCEPRWSISNPRCLRSPASALVKSSSDIASTTAEPNKAPSGTGDGNSTAADGPRRSPPGPRQGGPRVPGATATSAAQPSAPASDCPAL